MNVIKESSGSQLTLRIQGRLDTTTAPQLETELKASVEGVAALVLDLAELAYISSAGLRVVLMAQKIMNKQGTMVVRNVDPNVLEVFEVTGFSDILTIE